MTSMLERARSHIHPVVFPVSAGVIVAFVIFGAGWSGTEEDPGIARESLIGLRDWITANLGWFMILAVAVFLIFCLVLAFSRFGRIRLGPDDSRPDYSTLTWFAMMFSAGMGIGLMFWGVAEPVSHYIFAPRVDPETVEAAREAMLISYHHWGLLPWAVYAVLGLSLAYFGFRHDLPMTIRSALYPLIGDRIHGWMGNTVDVLAIFGTMFGVATSLGLGVLQINAGMNQVFGTPQNVAVQITLIAVITLIATVSVFTGLDRGIRRLSQLNINLAALLLVFVAIAGPTVLLVSSYVENLGAYLFNFVDILGWSGAYSADDAAFLSAWTVFYWAWWISWAPFVGMFIARVSRGRTVREFIVCVLLIPSLVSVLWMTAFGGTAITQLVDDGYQAVADSALELQLFMMLDALPLTQSGKVDRNALPEPQAHATERAYVAPRTDVEATLAQALHQPRGNLAHQLDPRLAPALLQEGGQLLRARRGVGDGRDQRFPTGGGQRDPPFLLAGLPPLGKAKAEARRGVPDLVGHAFDHRIRPTPRAPQTYAIFRVPCIDGWMAQTYVTVPARSTATENPLPGSSVPESNEPSLAVTVWASGSSLIQLTSVPAGTSRVSGSKAKPWMATASPAPVGAWRTRGASGRTSRRISIPRSSCPSTQHSILYRPAERSSGIRRVSPGRNDRVSILNSSSLPGPLLSPSWPSDSISRSLLPPPGDSRPSPSRWSEATGSRSRYAGSTWRTWSTSRASSSEWPTVRYRRSNPRTSRVTTSPAAPSWCTRAGIGTGEPRITAGTTRT